MAKPVYCRVAELVNTIGANSYKTHDEEDPLLQKILIHELRRRNINITIDDIITIDCLKRSISQNSGNFWQKTLGDAPGWRDLQVGHPTGCDMMNRKAGIIMELKNKHNTMNSSSLATTIKKLEAAKNARGLRPYIGIVNTKDNRPGQIKPIQNTDVTIVSGEELFSLVTGNREFKRHVIATVDEVYSDIEIREYSRRLAGDIIARVVKPCKDNYSRRLAAES
jgi:hypothetical protein